MAVLYTPEQIQGVLTKLRIKPVDGMVDTQEAARILTWRAEAEQGVKHTYTVGAVRRHVLKGNLKAVPESTRFNRYRTEDVFDLPLAPNRGKRTEPGTGDTSLKKVA